MPRDFTAYAEPLAQVDEDAKILLRAVDILAWFGHSPGPALGSGGSVCAQNAIASAIGPAYGGWAYPAFTRCCDRAGIPTGPEIFLWNPEQTADSLIARLRAAAGRP